MLFGINSGGSLFSRGKSNKFRYMLEQPYSLKLLKNIIFLNKKSLKLVNQQETLIFIRTYCILNNKRVNILGSSETTCETTFNFNIFKANLVSHKKSNTISISFLQWFVGFVEGDGSFIISKSRLFFIINQKCIKTLFFIKKILGFGSVSFYKNYSRFIVTKNEDILRLIYLFNGNLVLDKTNKRFESWLLQFNINNSTNFIFKKFSGNYDFLLSTFWLSGFISAEGCFNALVQVNPNYKIGYRFRVRFIVDQKDELFFMQQLLFYFGIGRVEKRMDNNYRFVIDSFKGCSVVLAYLNKYPLYHITKRLCYLRWKRYFNFIINQPIVNVKKIIRLAKNINKVEDIVQS